MKISTNTRFRMQWGAVAVAAVALALATGCAAEPVNPDPSDSESELAVETKDVSCAGAEKYGELAQLSCKLGEPVDENGFTQAERGPVAAPGEESTLARRQYSGACTGWGGCSRIAAEGWEATSCGAFLYVYMIFEGDYGNLIGSGTGVCLW